MLTCVCSAKININDAVDVTTRTHCHIHAHARAHTHRSRRQLMTKSFDLEDKWLQFRMMNKLRYDFLSTPLNERVAALEEAVDGGSVSTSFWRLVC